MSNRANKTQAKCKKYASKVDGFDHNGFVTRSNTPATLKAVKTCTVTGLRREMARMGLNCTGKVTLVSKLGNVIPLKVGDK